ncbi:transposase [Runella limosa]|uniref:transposase n=1 Tax=Runella limosa TaxID=370978 RepID=UPI001E627DEE|nr:transposase [Runella limosa]
MASSKYYIRNPEEVYFLTSTVVDWVDVFTRPIYKDIIVDSLRYCQSHKGLMLYGWVLMSNHLHLLVQAKEGKLLGDIMRDFKRFTANRLLEAVQFENESRKEWLMHKFEWNGMQNINLATRSINFGKREIMPKSVFRLRTLNKN